MVSFFYRALLGGKLTTSANEDLSVSFLCALCVLCGYTPILRREREG